MRVLVTGASGFIGSHVVQRLAASGQEVIASGRSITRLTALAAGAVVKPADLTVDELAPLLDGCNAVVHCAARAAPWGHRSLFWSDNVIATERLVAAAGQAESVHRFVHLSSPSIYFRPCDQINVGERFELPERWATSYAETKWQAEIRVLENARLGPVILRPRAVFGPRDAHIVPRILSVAQTGFFPLPAGGRAWTDITHVDNVVDAVLCALRPIRNIEGRAFNITNGEPLQVRELVSKLMAALHLKTRFISLPRRPVLWLARCNERLLALRNAAREPRLTAYAIGLLGYSQTLSIAAARESLGYMPRVSIEEGLAQYALWRRSHDEH